MTEAFPGNGSGNFLALDLVYPEGVEVKLKGPTSAEKVVEPGDHELLLRVQSTDQVFEITSDGNKLSLSMAGLTLEQA